jgi:hypothetical protein
MRERRSQFHIPKEVENEMEAVDTKRRVNELASGFYPKLGSVGSFGLLTLAPRLLSCFGSKV